MTKLEDLRTNFLISLERLLRIQELCRVNINTGKAYEQVPKDLNIKMDKIEEDMIESRKLYMDYCETLTKEEYELSDPITL